MFKGHNDLQPYLKDTSHAHFLTLMILLLHINIDGKQTNKNQAALKVSQVQTSLGVVST